MSVESLPAGCQFGKTSRLYLDAILCKSQKQIDPDRHGLIQERINAA